MSATARMMAWLGLDPKDFNRGVDQAHAKTKGFASHLDGLKGKLAAAFTVAAVGAAVKSVVTQAGDLIHAAENLRVTTEEYQALAEAARRLGIDEETLNGALQKVMRAQEEAASAGGSKEMISNFETLGISLHDLDTLDPAQIFERMAAAAQKGSTEMAAMNAVIGKSGPRFRGLSEEVSGKGLDRMIEEARAAGKIIGDEELEAMHQAELKAESGASWLKKQAAKVIGSVINSTTGAGVGAESKQRADMSAENEAARARADEAEANKIAAEAAEIRRKSAYDALTDADKRLEIERQIADLDKKKASADTLTERAKLDKDRAELESKLAGLGNQTTETPVDQLRRIGAVSLGGMGGYNPVEYQKRLLKVAEKQGRSLELILAETRKKQSGVF